jgi:hypothetical protein
MQAKSIHTHPFSVIVNVLLDPHIVVVGVIVRNVDRFCVRLAFMGLVLEFVFFLAFVLVLVSAAFMLGS